MQVGHRSEEVQIFYICHIGAEQGFHYLSLIFVSVT